MNSTVSYIVSAVLALGFHAAVVGLLLVNWQDKQIPNTLPEYKYYIKATVVDENPYKVKKRKEEAAAKKRRLSRQEAALKQERLNLEAIEKARQRDLEKQLAAEKENEELAALTRAEAERIKTDRRAALLEAERSQMEQSLALSILEEQEYRLAVTDDEKAMAYVSQIQREIVENWSRPPSARNGMEALLRVFLVPTGEIVDVVLQDSSGNDAFDRSAILAVRKAERFQVPGDSRQFERNFREFTVLFRPEDLRL